MLSEPCNALAKAILSFCTWSTWLQPSLCVTSESIYLPTVKLIESVISNSLSSHFVSPKSLDVCWCWILDVSLHKVGLTTWAVTKKSVLVTCEAFYVFTVLAREGTDSNIKFTFHKWQTITAITNYIVVWITLLRYRGSQTVFLMNACENASWILTLLSWISSVL